ncbi:MAG: hypothetical protein JXQ75_10695 [Phycisphaerae bacterium]|nr:hypothetical protein [Phycisphaerae bacterium]
MTAETPQDHIVVQCPCGAKLRVRAAAIGKKTRCPKCDGIVAITAPAPGPATPAPASPLDHGHGLLDESPQHEQTTKDAPSRRMSAAKACPNCGVPTAADARLCIACGYDIEKECQREVVVTPASGGAGALATQMAKSAGTFVVGSVLSLVGALIGGAVWFAVVWYLNAEVGYIAWGVGVLAGAGMLVGSRSPSAKAGVVAAGMSAVGIVAAKAAIFFLVIVVVLSGDTDDIDLQRQFVASRMSDEILTERGIDPESLNDEEWGTAADSAWDEAERRVTRMSDQEVRAKWQEYRDQDAAMAAAEGDSPAGKEPGEEVGFTETATALLPVFFSTQFGVFDILWFLLALGSAFKIASAGTRAGGGD